MSQIRIIHHGHQPSSPATDQHPDAKRYGPITRANGGIVYVDALGGEPTLAEIEAVLAPGGDPASPLR